MPLVIRWPGVTQAGAANDTPVVTMDLAATILDAAGMSLAEKETLDGQSLRPLFTGGQLQRDALFFHYPHYAFHKSNRPGSAIRRDQYKLIWQADDDSVELYDLTADLGETNNLAKAKPEVAQELKGRLVEWLEETKAGLPERREPQ